MTFTLLTGKPGVGKSTAVRAIADRIAPSTKVGFVTSEIRVGGRRQGFQTVMLTGESGVLAAPDVESTIRFGSLNGDGLPRLGVSLSFLEDVACPVLDVPEGWGGTVVLDEIGPMQAASRVFRACVERLADRGVQVVGSIAVSDDPWISGLAGRPDVAIIALSKENRDVVTAALAAYFASSDG